LGPEACQKILDSYRDLCLKKGTLEAKVPFFVLGVEKTAKTFGVQKEVKWRK